MGKDFFDNFGEAISKKARELGGRAESLYETQKMKNRIAGEERQVQKLMAELGKMIYRRYLDGVPLEEAQKVICEQIDQRMDRISRCKEELAGVRGRKICPSCGSSVDGDACFCPHCGTACPTKETDEDAGDVVDGTAEEVTGCEEPDISAEDAETAEEENNTEEYAEKEQEAGPEETTEPETEKA